MGVASTYSKPEPDQLEISLIGTGGGYGESILVHIGNGDWIIVDSCQDPNSNKNLPLEYLANLGVDPAESVKLIICTHWHDDHILGMSEILTKCAKAEFCISKITDLGKFLFLVGLDYSKIGKTGSLSSTKEFNECIKILEERSKKFKGAYPDRTLLTKKINDTITTEILSLSPSDETIKNFDGEISQLITEYGSSSKKLLIESPNDKSVVIYIKFGKHKAMLGADLEVTKSDDTGWHSIILNSVVSKEKANYFKIPHHGSENGFHEKIWTELLEKDPNANLTPWNKGNGLPTSTMISKYKDYSSKLFITSPTLSSKKPKKRDKSIEKIIEKFKYKLTEVKFTKGIIRNRVKPQDSNWQTDVFESAFKI